MLVKSVYVDVLQAHMIAIFQLVTDSSHPIIVEVINYFRPNQLKTGNTAEHLRYDYKNVSCVLNFK